MRDNDIGELKQDEHSPERRRGGSGDKQKHGRIFVYWWHPISTQRPSGGSAPSGLLEHNKVSPMLRARMPGRPDASLVALGTGRLTPRGGPFSFFGWQPAAR